MSHCAHCGAELPEGARFCPACGATTEPARPTEERKLATVLFADLVGSTELASGQDPERTRAVLDRFYDAMAEEVALAGGTLEKFAGDAVMASFGAPAALEDHAERALHAALAMQRRLTDLFEGALGLRIGVNTGDVIVGRPREGSSFVSGDAVNVAARLEQAAAPGEILAGERTAAAVGGAFELGAGRAVEAKGKEGGVGCRPVLRALSLMRPRGGAGLGAAFVGRERELELLEATYRRAVEQGEPHMVTIMGDSGVGKTRLVRELWHSLADESPAPLRRAGRCMPYGRGITYWPLAEMLKEHLGILESDPPERVLRLLAGREALAAPLGIEDERDSHPLQARERLHEGWVGFLGELAADHAVVLVEDLHWAEDDLLELLERFLHEVRGPLLLLGTARPELLDRRPAWGAGRRNTSLVWLEPLSDGDTERMLAELLAAELPVELRSLVVDRAEGNPFYVEEVVATLVDRGVLTRRNGGWVLGDLPEGFAVPDSVHALVAARIDLLPADAKSALQAAAVIGRVFWTRPVSALIGAEPDLDLLEERDFVRRRPGSTFAGDREYAVKHAVTREVAYASVPKARRARLHAACADWLEANAEARDELAPVLAHHFAEAVRPEDADLAWPEEHSELERLRGKAVTWLGRAGRLAVGRCEIVEGVALLHRALELESDDLRRAELWREMGRAHAFQYDGAAFWKAMEEALALEERPEHRAEIYSELALHTIVRSGMWRTLPDRERIGRWVEQALELAGPESPARARALIARGYFDRSTEAAREGSSLAERIGDADLRSYAWDAWRLALRTAGDYREALNLAQRRFELLDEIRDPDHVVDIYVSISNSCAQLGRFREAHRLAVLHDEATASLTPHHRMHGVAVLVELETIMGRWTAVRALQERAAQAATDNVATPCVRNASAQLLCAVANAQLGHDAEARRLEEQADSVGMSWRILDVAKLRLALVRGDLELAEQLLVEDPEGFDWFGLITGGTRLDALAALRRRDDVEKEAPDFLRRGAYLEPFALRALGVVRDDDELLRGALERFEAMGLDFYAGETRDLLAAG